MNLLKLYNLTHYTLIFQVNRLQNTDFDSDEELPQLSLKPCKQPKNIALVLNSNEPGFVASINQGKDCSKQARKIPYSKNDFLSDSSDNDVEMVETLSLKERLLGKQSTFTYKEFTGNLIGTSINCDQHDQQKENLKNKHSKNVIEIIECCDMDDEISNENFCNNSDQDYSQTSSTSNTIECVNKNKSLDLNLHVPGLEKSDKPIKRKRTTEEIEDRKRQAQVENLFIYYTCNYFIVHVHIYWCKLLCAHYPKHILSLCLCVNA